MSVRHYLQKLRPEILFQFPLFRNKFLNFCRQTNQHVFITLTTHQLNAHRPLTYADQTRHRPRALIHPHIMSRRTQYLGCTQNCRHNLEIHFLPRQYTTQRNNKKRATLRGGQMSPVISQARRQVTPSRPSSKITPAAARLSRIASARAQSFAARAAARSAIAPSTRASTT